MNSKTIEVFIDFRAPAAYLALEPTLALAQDYGARLSWRPFIARIERVPEPSQNETKGETHRRVRAQARRDMHELYARLRNVTMNFRADPGQADLALSVLDQLDETQRSDFVTRCFEAYWQNDADLDDEATVSALADAPVSRASLESAHAAAGELGVIDVPAYVIEDQLFIGREHLPWIRSILTG